MVSIKLKFRASTAKGKEGRLYYQLIYKRVVRQVLTPYKIFPEEWDAINESLLPAKGRRETYLSGIRPNILYEQKLFQQIIVQAETSGKPFTINELITEFHNRNGIPTLFKYITKQIAILQQHEQERTAETYQSTLNSFQHFRRYKDVELTAVDAHLLTDYECFLKSNGLSPNTVVFYMKRLQAIYNKAVDDELTPDRHPFKKVCMISEKTAKRAISLKYIKILKELDLSNNPTKCMARDMFLFSFYTRGMSFVDMALLRKTNLQNNTLTYRRKKTGQLQTLHWEPCMKAIAKKYASTSDSPYLLSIIRDPQKSAKKLCHNALTLINRHLKEIGISIGLHSPLTMYVARHSWASIARDEGIPLSVISEAMGHESEKTTRIYLASLETQVIDKANQKILGKL